jgi:nucleotide-binding universal stress UspA family protein
MINHILVPLDGSELAECVLPHVLAIALAVDARITLLHVMEFPHVKEGVPAIDPLEWHLKKREAEVYLSTITAQLQNFNLIVNHMILEGLPAEGVVEFGNNNDVDLIALSTHGRSGLSEWNISSVVQKIILRSYKSTLLVRANKSLRGEPANLRYSHVFVGLDCSARAEYILPLAIELSQYYKAQLILGTVIPKPKMLHRLPFSEDDDDLVTRIVARNERAAFHYFDQLRAQISMQGVDLKTRLIASENTMTALHDMVEQENADLVMLVAHGHSGAGRWPYGSIAASFISYGGTALLILQDLHGDEIKRTQTEIAVRETKGH